MQPVWGQEVKPSQLTWIPSGSHLQAAAVWGGDGGSWTRRSSTSQEQHVWDVRLRSVCIKTGCESEGLTCNLLFFVFFLSLKEYQLSTVATSSAHQSFWDKAAEVCDVDPGLLRLSPDCHISATDERAHVYGDDWGHSRKHLHASAKTVSGKFMHKTDFRFFFMKRWIFIFFKDKLFPLNEHRFCSK